MYCQHFNLKKKPFQINSDNKFLWLSKTHALALESLKKGLAAEKGLLILTGDIGTGKTTLVNEIIHTLDAGTRFVQITDPCFEIHHIFEYIAQALGFDPGDKPDKYFPDVFFPFINTAENNGQKIVIIVDEAQRMPIEFFKAVLHWFESGLTRGLTILLAGQLEFEDLLATHLGDNWKDYIPVHARLEPLNEQETLLYINQRLKIAGAHRKIFLVAAAQRVHAWSKGFPRLINITCDQALIAAFAKKMRLVDVPTITQAIGELDLPQASSSPPDPKKENHMPNRSGALTKRMAYILSAVFCLYLGDLVYTGFAINDPAPPLPVPATVQESAGPKTSLEIGLGYTPAPPNKKNHLKPVPALKRAKNTHPSNPAPQKTRNLDQFIEDVFVLKHPLQTAPEKPIVPRPIIDTGPGLNKINAHDLLPLPDPKKDAVSIPPEPTAIIDWLLEQKTPEILEKTNP